MEILRAELEKKKRQLEESNLVQPNKKYIRKADIIAKEQEEYLKKYGPKNIETNTNTSKTTEGGNAENEGTEGSALPRKDVIKRLRERSEPILLFGETELEAFKRLRRCEILEPEVNKGLRNDFQEAMEKVDQDYLDQILASTAESDASEQSEEIKVQESKVTYEQIQSMAANLGKGDRHHDMEVIVEFLQFILKMWGSELSSRSGSEKMATRGKMALAKYTQTQIYLKPLLRKLRSKTLPEDISDSLTEITRHLLDRNYIMASHAYLQMAIGNAPWPIGVTMVGIHARTGREKIFSKNVAHVLNDETQRKYIQALKRLMTKCQQFYPTDPSRCVEYAASTN